MSLISNLPLDFRARMRPASANGQNEWVEFDASLSENHKWRNEVTRIPTESGSVRTDHINTQPFQIEMRIRLADVVYSKLNPYAGVTTLIQGGFDSLTKNRSTALLKKIIEWGNKKETVYLITGLNVYPSLEIEEINSIRDITRANGEIATLKLVEIQEFSSKTGEKTRNVAEEVKHTFGFGSSNSLGLLS